MSFFFWTLLRWTFFVLLRCRWLFCFSSFFCGVSDFLAGLGPMMFACVLAYYAIFCRWLSPLASFLFASFVLSLRFHQCRGRRLSSTSRRASQSQGWILDLRRVHTFLSSGMVFLTRRGTFLARRSLPLRHPPSQRRQGVFRRRERNIKRLRTSIVLSNVNLDLQ